MSTLFLFIYYLLMLWFLLQMLNFRSRYKVSKDYCIGGSLYSVQAHYKARHYKKMFYGNFIGLCLTVTASLLLTLDILPI